MREFDKEKLAALVLQRMYPVYVMDEETKEIVFSNEVLEGLMGRSLVGENCYQVFFGTETPHMSSPEEQAEGVCYQWEYFDQKQNKLYKICNVWFEQNGTRYRVGVATDASDLMGLNRSVVDYLWLMQELSALQLKIMRDQKNTLSTLLQFFRMHYKAKRVIVSWQDVQTPITIYCDEAGLTRTETRCERDAPHSIIHAHNAQFRFWLEEMEDTETWEEDSEFVLSMARTYLENERLRAQVEWENTHDKATGLLNRACFQKNVCTFYKDLQQIGILYADIDNLKKVNDEWGHTMGDRLIQKAADVLVGQSGEQVQAYRMGGDEFVVLCRSFNETDLEALKQQITQELEKSNEVIPMPQISISMGLAHSRHPYDVEQLMKLADEQMYKEKRRKKAGRS